jgi:hypothetical protein
MPEQFAGLVLIAAGLESDDLDGERGIGASQQPGNLVRLRQCHRTLARADP